MFGWGRKKPEPVVETRVMSLDEVGPALDRVLEQEAKLLIDRTRGLRDAINSHMARMIEIAAQMEAAPLGDDVDARVATVAKRGKNQVVEAIRKHAGAGIEQATSVEEVRAFNKASTHVLSHVGDVLGKQTRVIHMFSKKHAGLLKDTLAAYAEDSKAAKDLLGRYEATEEARARAAELVSQIHASQSGAAGARERAGSLSSSAERLDAEATSKDEAATHFKDTAAYKERLRVLAKINALGKKRKDLEISVGNIMAPVSKAVSKYRYGSSLDKGQLAVAATMLDSPLDAFVPGNKSDIAQILENTKKAVEKGHMSVKDPSKTIAGLDEAVARLNSVIDTVDRHATEKNKLESELASADVSQMEKDERAASKARADAELARSRASEALAEADALEAKKPGLVEELSSVASRALGSPCRVKQPI